MYIMSFWFWLRNEFEFKALFLDLFTLGAYSTEKLRKKYFKAIHYGDDVKK